MTRKIQFPYETQSKQIPFIYTDRNQLTSFPFRVSEKKRQLVLPVQFEEAVRKLSLPIGRDSRIIPFPISQQAIVPATLGAMDPYTMGELDAMTLDFMMWADSKELVFDRAAGANGESIFLHGHPKHLDFWYNRDVRFPFYLGKHFMDTWFLPFMVSGNYLCTEAATPLPVLDSFVENLAKSIGTHLHSADTELLGYIMLYFKMDPHALGALDPYPLWALSYTTANAMELGTTTATVSSTVDVETKENLLYLHTSTPGLSSQITGEFRPAATSMMSFKCWRNVTLGDLDPYLMGDIDPKPLGMKFYGNTPAVVTVDAAES